MSSTEKLVQKFLSRQNAITIADVRRLMTTFGYEEKKKHGSECVFHKTGSLPFNVPTVKGRTVKSRYVKQLVKFLNLEEWYEENKGD